MKQAYLLLIAGYILRFRVSYGQDDCNNVDIGLESILAPCSQSVTECVTARNLAGLSEIFCIPKARMQFENFNRCTNGNFSNQIFGALCGGSECMGAGGICGTADMKCFEMVDVNNATEVFKDCMCDSPPSPNQNQLSCPSSTCKNSLQELVRDVGCCTNTVLYVFYLNSCVRSPSSSTFTQDGLGRLFEACDIPFPSSCPHLFSALSGSPSGSRSTRVSSEQWLILAFAMFLFSN